MLEACAQRVPGAELKQASAESLPWADDSFDAALAQLVVHFMDDPAAGAAEMRRVTRAGGHVAACTWDFGGGMALLRNFWQSVRAFEPDADAETSPFGEREHLEELWRESGLADVKVEGLEVSTRYEDFDELWGSFLLGVGPAGQHAIALPPDRQAVVRDEYRRRLGDPAGSFTLKARAWAVRGVVPD
jgi:SAM-dependent methyltransferase